MKAKQPIKSGKRFRSGMTSQKPVKGRRDNSGQAVGNKDSDEEDSNIEDSAFDLSRDIRGFEKHLSEVEEEEVEEDEENEEDSFHENDLDDEEQDEVDEEVVYLEGEEGDSRVGQSEEDMLVRRFLSSSKAQSRTLADIILEKLQEKEARAGEADGGRDVEAASASALPPKVVEVYTSVGQMLQHYKSGKLPKALKMLPHLRDWERVLWLTRPDLWSPVATYCVTRIFVSNLKAKMAQRFLNLVLLEKVRDDIDGHGKLNYHLYLALKKALFKPAAFYKGVLLPLAISGSCSLREATIVGSVLTKVSVPAIHSAAALLRLAEMPYCGSTSVFLKTLLAKKYALPLRVISALHGHFLGFLGEKRVLPVVWHQSLLVFVQRYKLELSATQKDELLQLLRLHSHHEISPEIRRELALAKA